MSLVPYHLENGDNPYSGRVLRALEVICAGLA